MQTSDIWAYAFAKMSFVDAFRIFHETWQEMSLEHFISIGVKNQNGNIPQYLSYIWNNFPYYR